MKEIVAVFAILITGAPAIVAQNPTPGVSPRYSTQAPTRRMYPGIRSLPGAPVVTNAPGGNSNEPALPPGQPIATNANGQVIMLYPGVASLQTNATGLQSNAVASGRSNVTPVQLQNINQLDVALSGLELEAPVSNAAGQTPDLKETLEHAPIGKVRPAKQSIDGLAASLKRVVPSLHLPGPQRRQLAIDLNMALNSGNLSPDQARRVVTDVRGILSGSSLGNPAGVNELTKQISDLVSNTQAHVRNTQRENTGHTAVSAGDPDPNASK